MADPRGFLKWRDRELPPNRPVPVRLLDWQEVAGELDSDERQALLHRQAGRCMDCGIPFCHHGCPLGNLIPEWNDLVFKDQWAEASDRLHATNNFPEVTGRICPATCETSCVLGISQPAVTIKSIEMNIADQAFERDLVTPQPPYFLTGNTVAVVGSGPAGLAAAQQLTRAGHTVAVFERDDRIGGLMRYGVPDFKLAKHHIDRRIVQMEAEGTRFRPGVEVGVDIGYAELLARYDAVLLATGARVPRRLDVPGTTLKGIHPAMDFLHQANQVAAGDKVDDQIVATDKHVVIIGSGDTGSDCLGTALRQGALSVTGLDIAPKPPPGRPVNQPWPVDPVVFKVSSSHEEGGEREYLASTREFLADADGHVRALRMALAAQQGDGQQLPAPDTEREIRADLVIFAMGFTGPETESVVAQTGVGVTGQGLIARGDDYSTSVPGMFVAGDAGRGQSLVVWAIAEGRSAAAGVDAYLRGSDTYLQGKTELPAPVDPTARGLRP